MHSVYLLLLITLASCNMSSEAERDLLLQAFAVRGNVEDHGSAAVAKISGLPVDPSEAHTFSVEFGLAMRRTHSPWTRLLRQVTRNEKVSVFPDKDQETAEAARIRRGGSKDDPLTDSELNGADGWKPDGPGGNTESIAMNKALEDWCRPGSEYLPGLLDGSLAVSRFLLFIAAAWLGVCCLPSTMLAWCHCGAILLLAPVNPLRPSRMIKNKWIEGYFNNSK